MNLSNDNIVDLFQMVGAAATAAACIYIARTFVNERRSEELKLTEQIFDVLRELESEYSSEITGQTPGNRNRRNWFYRYFDVLEWTSLLINEKIIKNKKIKKYFLWKIKTPMVSGIKRMNIKFIL